MKSLTANEGKRLARVEKIYEETMEEKGIETLMNELREELKRRFETNPPRIALENGEMLTIPFDTTMLGALRIMQDGAERALTPNERQSALIEYYNDINHTAFRYLQIPNPLADIHTTANVRRVGYANDDYDWRDLNADEDEERLFYSTFEDYAHLIALLWVAVNDSKRPPPLLKNEKMRTPEQAAEALETRIVSFIVGLASIGRAHNMDKEPRLDARGQPEEYDDFEGDKPSCETGVERRIFQGVINHPDVNMLTMDTVRQELNEYVYSHFKSKITAENKAEIREACENYFIYLEEAYVTPLKQFDFSLEQQQEFIALLTQKYGNEFSNNKQFKDFVTKQFHLNEGEFAHALKFYSTANLEQLLKPAPLADVPVSQIGHFSSTSSPTAKRKFDEADKGKDPDLDDTVRKKSKN